MSPPTADLFFSTFKTSQAFFKSSHSFAIVNLKPILPGHVLVCPRRVVARHADLTPTELTDLYLSVQKVGKAIESGYNGQALTISCQDGPAAGQSVPHVHIHCIPRKPTDFNGINDQVYPILESAEDALQDDLIRSTTMTDNDDDDGLGRRAMKKGRKFKVDADEDRPPRSLEEMEREARWLEDIMEKIRIDEVKEGEDQS